MGVCVIEINDCALVATLADRGRIVESPGYAIIEGERIVVGSDAYSRARLTPRGSHNRYWDQLGLDPLPRGSGGARTQADLAYAHLREVWRQIGARADAVVLAVPGTFDRTQLGLLLGIAQECGMPVIGMVDSAVAAARATEPAHDLAVLDLQLHRSVITRIDDGAEASRRTVDDISQNGMIALYDAWANAISDAFVHATRFDPLHLADTEQALYDRLPKWLVDLHDEPRAVLELQARQKTHSVAVDRRQLLTAADRIYRQITQTLQLGRRPGRPMTVQITARALALPGLLEHLRNLPDAHLLELTPDAVATGVFGRLDNIRTAEGQSVGYVTSLPWLDTDRRTAAKSAAISPARLEQPTHLLHGSRAYSLLGGAFLIGAEIPARQRGLCLHSPGVRDRHCQLQVDEDGQVLIEDLSGGNTFVNGTRIEHQAIGRTGDSIRIGEEIRVDLITVVEDHGA